MHLLLGDLNVTRVDTLDDVVGRLAVHSAANALRGAKNLLHGARELLRERLGLHCPCNVEDLVQGDVAGVLDVLLLLAVAWGLCGRSVKMLRRDRRVTHP